MTTEASENDEQRETAVEASADAEASSGGRLRRARGAIRGYYRWLRLSRLAFVACIIMAGFFLLWVVPWLPSGLEADDYTPKVAFTIYLLGGTSLVGMLALAFREMARRDREAVLVWSTVYDEATGLHNRTYLYDRLSLECERASRSGNVFSVIVLQIRVSDSKTSAASLSREALQKIGQLVDSFVHPSDPVALLSGNEIAVLAIRVGQVDRLQIQERLRETALAQLPGLLSESIAVDLKAGASTYGIDGADPGSLVQAARLSAVMSSPHRTRAA